VTLIASPRTIAAAGALVLLCCGCGGGPSSGFTLSNANVQPNFVCPAAATTPYGLQATVSGRNSTSSAVTIKSASAALTVAAVNGGWLQKVGYRYDAGNLQFSPDHVAAGAGTTLTVTIPSSCTNHKTGGQLSYAEYSVALTFVTSAGTFRIESRNRHRIIA
jgi:plastocyanin